MVRIWAVTDEDNNCVWILDQPARKIGSYGDGNGEFNRPLGVAFDANDHLYVTDYTNQRVQKFDFSGKYLLQLDMHQSGKASHIPIGITVHNDKVCVCDGDCVLVFNCDGRFSHPIGLGHFERGLLHCSQCQRSTFCSRLWPGLHHYVHIGWKLLGQI